MAETTLKPPWEPFLPAKPDAAWMNFQAFLTQQICACFALPPTLIITSKEALRMGYNAAEAGARAHFIRQMRGVERQIADWITGEVERRARHQLAVIPVYRVLVRVHKDWHWYALPDVSARTIDEQVRAASERYWHVLVARFLVRPADSDWVERLCLEMDSRLLWCTQGRFTGDYYIAGERIMTADHWLDRKQAISRLSSRALGGPLPHWMRALREE